MFSKRTAAIDVALAAKLDEFRQREGRDPSRWERAALTREASADTRAHKSGHGVPDLTTRWQSEAAGVGWTAEQLTEAIAEAGRRRRSPRPITVGEVIDELSETRSAWSRADVLQAICDLPAPGVAACRDVDWADAGSSRRPTGSSADLGRPRPGHTRVAPGLGWSVGVDRTDRRPTSRPRAILAQEEAILAWAMAAQLDDRQRRRRPSARSASTRCRPTPQRRSPATTGSSLVVGPAGAGKTRMLAAAVDDLARHGRAVFGVAPTAKAARVLEARDRHAADTVAKLLHEWHRTDRPPRPGVPAPGRCDADRRRSRDAVHPGLHHLVDLAEAQPLATRRSSVTHDSCKPSVAAACSPSCAPTAASTPSNTSTASPTAGKPPASLQLRAGDPRALDAYEPTAASSPAPSTTTSHDIADRLDRPSPPSGRSVGVVASTNDHVDHLNQRHPSTRLASPANSTRHCHTDRRRRDRLRRRRRHDPPQRPPPRHQQRRAGPQPRHLDRQRPSTPTAA